MLGEEIHSNQKYRLISAHVCSGTTKREDFLRPEPGKVKQEGLETGLKRQPRTFEQRSVTYLYAKVMHSKSFVNEASMEIWDMLAFPK